MSRISDIGEFDTSNEARRNRAMDTGCANPTTLFKRKSERRKLTKRIQFEDREIFWAVGFALLLVAVVLFVSYVILRGHWPSWLFWTFGLWGCLFWGGIGLFFGRRFSYSSPMKSVTGEGYGSWIALNMRYLTDWLKDRLPTAVVDRIGLKPVSYATVMMCRPSLDGGFNGALEPMRVKLWLGTAPMTDAPVSEGICTNELITRVHDPAYDDFDHDALRQESDTNRVMVVSGPRALLAEQRVRKTEKEVARSRRLKNYEEARARERRPGVSYLREIGERSAKRREVIERRESRKRKRRERETTPASG